MSREEQLKKLQDKTRQLGEDLRALMGQIEEQQTQQREQLEAWSYRLADLLTFLMNLDSFLGLDGEGDGADDVLGD